MSFSELLEAVKALPREERQCIVDSLNEDLARPTDEELVAKYFPPGMTFEVWSPFDSFEAAAALQKLLDAKKQVSQ